MPSVLRAVLHDGMTPRHIKIFVGKPLTNEGVPVLGIDDINVVAALWTLFISAMGCVAYGVVNWQNDGPEDEVEVTQEIAWLEEENALDDDMAGGKK